MTPSAYWHMLEAEGRLKWEGYDAQYDGVNYHQQSYYRLRLTEEERERLRVAVDTGLKGES